MSGNAPARAACAKTAAAILAGGKSRRMGRPKAFLPLGDQPLIARVIAALKRAFSELFIVASDGAPFGGLGLPVVPDKRPGAGAFGGVFTAIEAASTPQVLVVACDMPYLNADLLAHLALRAEGHAAAVPRAADGLHPLHAVYAKRAGGAFAAAMDRGALKLMDVLSALDCIEVGESEMRRLDPGLHSLFNVNRPEDLDRARALLAGPGGERPDG